MGVVALNIVIYLKDILTNILKFMIKIPEGTQIFVFLRYDVYEKLIKIDLSSKKYDMQSFSDDCKT